jgi:hypothetical protein
MTENQVVARFEVVGVNDERDTCECCGRKNLKRVVWIRDTETDEVKHFGTVCATAPAKGFDLVVEIKAAIAKFDSLNKMRVYLAAAQYRREGGKYVPNGPGSWTAADRPHLDRCIAEWANRSDFNY